MFRIAALAAAFAGVLAAAAPAVAGIPIEPRSLQWNIVSDREMAKICQDNGLKPSCEGMAAWDKEFRMCVIWTRSPRSEDDKRVWAIVHHELHHCQAGHFHN